MEEQTASVQNEEEKVEAESKSEEKSVEKIDVEEKKVEKIEEIKTESENEEVKKEIESEEPKPDETKSEEEEGEKMEEATSKSPSEKANSMEDGGEKEKRAQMKGYIEKMAELKKMSAEELFAHYELTDEQIEVFKKVRAEEVDYISDLRLILVVCCKKTVEKCLKLCPEYFEVIKQFKLDEFSFEDCGKHPDYLRVVKWGTIWALHDHPDKEGFNYVQFDYSRWVVCKDERELQMVSRVFLKIMEVIIFTNKKNTTEGLTGIFDVSTFKLRNIDWKIEHMFSKILSKFPVRLKRFILFNSPWYFKLFWALMKPFITKKMRSRIVMKSDPKCIFEYISHENVIEMYGGSVPFNYRKWALEAFRVDIEQAGGEEEEGRKVDNDEGEYTAQEVQKDIKEFGKKKGLMKEIMENYKNMDF